MTIKQTTLENGLRIVTAEIPDAQSVTASILVGTGSRYEDFDTNGGIAHFLEHMLFKGTKKRPSAKIISEEIDSVGGYNNAYTDFDHTNYFVKLPMEHTALALDIIADMIMNSKLEDEEIDRERGAVVEEMNMYRDNPQQFVGTLTPALLFPDDSLQHDIIGSEQVIKEAPRQLIVDYKNLYYSPNNMVVSVAGRAKHEDIVAQIRKLMGGLAPKEIEQLKPVKSRLAPTLAATLAKPTAQAHFVIESRAYAHEDPDEPAATLLAGILGRGMSSRLFINVRERKGLAYSIHASVQSLIDTGFFMVYAGVNLDKVPEAIEAVLEELADVRHQPVTEAELDKAKNQIRGGLRMAMEDNSNVAQRNGTQLLIYGKTTSVDERLAQIDAVTVADVQRVAREMLAPEALRFGIIAPEPEPAAKHFESVITKEK